MDSGPAPNGASRNDGEMRLRILATRCARGLHQHPPIKGRGRRKRRVRGAPAVPRAKGSAHGVVTTGHRNTRHSLRNGFKGLWRALPGDRAFLPPSPVRSLLLANLTPASGRQDHTALPYAITPFVRTLTHALMPPRPSHPVPNVRDDGQSPPCGNGTARNTPLIWVKREAKHFCEEGWTAKRAKDPSGKSVGSPSATRSKVARISEAICGSYEKEAGRCGLVIGRAMRHCTSETTQMAALVFRPYLRSRCRSLTPHRSGGRRWRAGPPGGSLRSTGTGRG